MALITKPPAWAYCTTNISGTPGASVGTPVASGANNADGSSVSAISAITHDVEYLVLYFHSFSASTANGSVLLDVLIDPAGGTSWLSTPLISDLLVGFSVVLANNAPPAGSYYFPIWVKSGSSIGLRARTAHTATVTGRVVVYAFGGNSHPASWWCGSTVETIGATPASSTGTSHTPGNSGAYSSWTNFGSTLSYNVGALQFGVHGPATATANQLYYYYEFGVNSTRIGAPIMRSTTTVENGWWLAPGVIFQSLPAGTQLQVRGTCSGTAQSLDVAAYAVS